MLKDWKVDGMVLGGLFIHVRHCAHIVNLIVNDGLKEFHMAIATNSNAQCCSIIHSRLAKFICIKRKKIECKFGYARCSY